MTAPVAVLSARRRRGGPSYAGTTYYVATTGSALNSGSLASPWSLTYALSGAGGTLRGNDTVLIRGGRYVGQFSYTATAGSRSTPITFRRYQTERVIIDGNVGSGSTQTRIMGLDADGVIFWGCEFTNSDSSRTSAQSGSNPSDMNWRSAKSVRVTAKFCKLINNLIYDTANGIEDQSIDTAWGNEHAGNIIWNTGWEAPDRGHGHCIYTQNSDSTGKTYNDNVGWGAYDITVQTTGTGSAAFRYFTFQRNVFGPGGVNGGAWSMQKTLEHAGDVTLLGATTYSANHFYAPSSGSANGTAVQISNAGELPSALPFTFTGNYGVGQIKWASPAGLTMTGNKLAIGATPVGGGKVLEVRRASTQAYNTFTIDSNAYAHPDADGPFYDVVEGGAATVRNFSGWKSTTGWDATSTETSANIFAGSDIIVNANPYEAGRGHIICWNWASAASLNVNPSSILANGDNYVIHHIYDLFGAPVASGTYAGGTIALGQTGYTAPVGIGSVAAPPSMAPVLNVFLVRKVTVTTVPTAPTIGTATALNATQIDVTWTDNSSNEAGFLIEQQTGTQWFVAGIALAGATTFRVSGLTAATAYTFRVRAYNEAGYSTASSTATATTGAATGTTILSDTMTGTAATTLTSHSPETGGAWTKHPADAGLAELSNANRLRVSSTTQATYYNAAVPATADYDVEADLFVASADVGTVWLLGRMSTSGPFAETFYGARYNGTALGWQLMKFDAAGAGLTQLGATSSQTLTAGNSYHLMLRMRGTTISLWVDGVSKISQVDATISQVGKVGFRVKQTAAASDSAGYHLDNVVATNA